MNKAFRKLHLQLAPIFLVLLIATAVTGIIVGLGSRFGGLPTGLNNFLIGIHQGGFLGSKLVPIYVLLMGLGVFAMGLTTLISSSGDRLISGQTKSEVLSAYKVLTPLIVFPLAVCVETGVAYRLGTDWLNMPSQQTEIFLSIHNGATLGTILGTFYTLLTGIGLIMLSIMGLPVGPFSTGKTKISRNRSQGVSARKTQSTPLALDNLLPLRKKIRFAIIVFSVVFTAILAFATNKIWQPILIIGAVFTLPASILAEKLIQDWQQQKKFQDNFMDKEAESATILRAIPDSMLRMTQDGICLSYIPAKGATSFVIRGEIVNKHVTEFLAPEIALQFIKSAQLSLKSGSTHFYRFPIPLDNGGQKYHEARISAIGATEVLIMVREIANFEDLPVEPEQPPKPQDNDSIRLLTEPELVEILESTLQDPLKQEQNHILCCLVVDNVDIDQNIKANSKEHFDSANASDFLIHQVAVKMKSYLSSNYIARLEKNELVSLVLNCSLEQASALVDELRNTLDNFSFQWQESSYPIKASICLLEINADSQDAANLLDVAKATCNMAKQKVDVKTFW
ncbi:diguanylate cyclase domain-containing protein [Pleurocapsa sp. PCC 7319]|uniref:GGDEF domain-containing protein n=1 Tax=Pleurocapsa sp. PCC 7319 TaxID=118161 RepID=UPI00034B0136|nr:diguanylate cyclase [Pleurocapsa sp. PCC 7319]